MRRKSLSLVALSVFLFWMSSLEYVAAASKGQANAEKDSAAVANLEAAMAAMGSDAAWAGIKDSVVEYPNSQVKAFQRNTRGGH